MKFPKWRRFRLWSCNTCQLTDSSHNAVNDEHHTKRKKKKLLSIYSCVQKYDLKQLFSCKKWQEAELWSTSCWVECAILDATKNKHGPPHCLLRLQEQKFTIPHLSMSGNLNLQETASEKFQKICNIKQTGPFLYFWVLLLLPSGETHWVMISFLW